jgi:hypothetical protein
MLLVDQINVLKTNIKQLIIKTDLFNLHGPVHHIHKKIYVDGKVGIIKYGTLSDV